MSQPTIDDDDTEVVDFSSSAGQPNQMSHISNGNDPPSVAASMSSSSLAMMTLMSQQVQAPAATNDASAGPRFGNNFIDVGDYDWMGVLDQAMLFNDDVGGGVQGGRATGGGGCCDDGEGAGRITDAGRRGEDVGDDEEDDRNRRRIHDDDFGINDDNDDNTAIKADVTSSTTAATTAVNKNLSRVEKKRSREKQRRLDTNSQLAALTNLVQDIDATDLAEEEAMAVAYNYARKARQWNNKGGQAETNNDYMIQGGGGGGQQQQQQQQHCGREDGMFDEDSTMMMMMNTMMESRHVVEGMVGVKGSPAGGFAIPAPPNLADLISQPNTVEGNAAKKFKPFDSSSSSSSSIQNDIPSSTTLLTLAAAFSTAAAAAASNNRIENNRIDLIARTIVQLKKLRQLRRVRIDELRAVRSQHCELRKECEELRKTVAHYKVVGMQGGFGGGPGGGAMGMAMGVSCGGYNGGGYQYQQQQQYQQEKVMMMVPMMVSPQDALYHQGPNCVPPAAAAAHPYHQAVRPYNSSMSTAAPSTTYHHQQPASIHGMHPQDSAFAPSLQQIQHQQHLLMTIPSPAENASQHPLPGTLNAGGRGGGEGLPQGTACVQELEQAHQSQSPPNTSATGTGTTMIATVGGIGSVHQHPPPQGGNIMVHHPPPLQQPPMMTMYPSNQVGIPVSTMSYGYNYPQQQQQQQQSMYQIVSQPPPPTYTAGHSLAPHNDHHHPNAATVQYQHFGLGTAVATGTPPQQQYAIATIDPPANNSFSHVNLDHDDSAITPVQPQHHLDGVGGDNIDQLLLVSSDKRSTSATSMNQAVGGGNLAHCA